MDLKNKPILYILLAYGVICALSIVFFDGTGDNGDSIMHYLFARYAPAHPELYFNHWAKPLFVLLASPFAQFGFIGMKLFNVLCGLFIIYLSYRCALLLQLNNALLVPVFLLFSPLNYILTFSGLTEPLFALMLVSGLFFSLKERFQLAATLISFLPYVRSEGLIIIGVFALYFFYKKQWRCLPLLLFGSIVYAIAGYFVYHEFLWVFTKIPYSTLSSVYGHGGLDHFVIELVNVMGVPLYALFWLGLVAMIYFTLKNKNSVEEKILVLGGFLCFFVAHTLFWYLGIFNSMGLKRVFIGVLPLMVLISLSGFNLMTNSRFVTRVKVQKGVQILLIVYVLVFPFTANPSAVQWNRDMSLEKDQVLAQQTTDFVWQHKKPGSILIFNHPYFSLTFKLDYFDPIKSPRLSAETIAHMNSGDIIIWDNHFSEPESLMILDDLYKLDCLMHLKTFTTFSHGKTVEFRVFEKTEKPCLVQ